MRGTAQQVVDKYQSLAREAATAGDPVMAENYYQHAEHYYRILHANGGGDNRQGGRQPEGDRSQEGDRSRDDNGSGEQQHQQAGGNGSDNAAVEAVKAEAVKADASDEQPSENRRNGQNGRKRSHSAPRDTEAEAVPESASEPAAPPPAATTTEETGEPVS